MADGPHFDFLADSWGIQLSDKAKTEIAENADGLTKRCIEEYIKDTDIRKFGVISSLPKDVNRHVGPLPPGKYLVQVQKSANITQPSKFQEDFDGGKWRLLAVEMSDGEQKLKAIEYTHVKSISVDTWPGTKLLLVSSAKSPLCVQNGHFLLTDATVQVIGGNVPKLVDSWRQSKEVQESRLLWKSEGIKKQADGEGAPPWVDFDPRKAPRGPQRSAEEERREWQKTMIGVTTKADEDKQRDGPRFQAEDFAEDDAPKVVSSQVSANAFKKIEKGDRKGKGKGKGEGGSRPEGGRRGRGDDEDQYQPEKRAPVANASLAAFIKPTKKGELPDEALNLLAADTADTAGGSGWDGGDWEEGSWDASGWGQGWSGGYGGGGYGGGGGGGQRKGGGKSRSKGGKGKGGGKRSGGGGKGYR